MSQNITKIYAQILKVYSVSNFIFFIFSLFFVKRLVTLSEREREGGVLFEVVYPVGVSSWLRLRQLSLLYELDPAAPARLVLAELHLGPQVTHAVLHKTPSSQPKISERWGQIGLKVHVRLVKER